MEMFNPIRLITEAFDANGLKYQVFETEEHQDIHAPFGINNGPFVDVRFISLNRSNDVSVRIVNLANRVPAEKRIRLLEVLNQLNSKYRFLKFAMDAENSIQVEYDFPAKTGDDSLGEMAVEVFIRTMQILNEGYIHIARALYSAEEPQTEKASSETKNLFRLLENGQDEINIRISKAAPSEDQEG